MPDSPSLLVRTPPPLLFAAALAIGLVFEREAPAALLPGASARFAMPFGAILVAAGASLAAAAILTLVRRKTTLNPVGEPSALVVDGPFARTRNPIYIAFALLVAGGGVWANSPWPLLLLPLPVLALHLAIVPHEERTLAARFGEAYRDYCARVRRWL